MAANVSIAALEADQQKLTERVEKMETVLKHIFNSFIQLFGNKLPVGIKKFADDWAADEVVIAKKTARSTVNLECTC